jgi:hypothetical protein
VFGRRGSAAFHKLDRLAGRHHELHTFVAVEFILRSGLDWPQLGPTANTSGPSGSALQETTGRSCRILAAAGGWKRPGLPEMWALLQLLPWSGATGLSHR